MSNPRQQYSVIITVSLFEHFGRKAGSVWISVEFQLDDGWSWGARKRGGDAAEQGFCIFCITPLKSHVRRTRRQYNCFAVFNILVIQ